MFTYNLLISVPLADEESWYTNKFGYVRAAGIQCLAILFKSNFCLRKAA